MAAKKRKKSTDDTTVISDVSVYIIDERSNNVLIILHNVDVPHANDHLVIYKDNYAIELTVTKRALVINADSNVIAWNIYTLPIGQAWEIDTDDNEEKKDDTNNELAS